MCWFWFEAKRILFEWHRNTESPQDLDGQHRPWYEDSEQQEYATNANNAFYRYGARRKRQPG